jgi:hypothetical protein
MSDGTQGLPRERTRTVDLPEIVSIPDGRSWTQLDLRVPKIGEIKKAQTHMRGTADSETRMMIVLVSLVAGLPEIAVDKIDYDIVMEAAEFLMSFMPAPPKISET